MLKQIEGSRAVAEAVAMCRPKGSARTHHLADPQGWEVPVAAAPTGKRVLVVGAGPSGMSAAYTLIRLGHSVTIKDAGAQPGGMMRYGIPKYRCPAFVAVGAHIGKRAYIPAGARNLRDRLRLLQGLRHLRRRVPLRGDRHGARAGLNRRLAWPYQASRRQAPCITRGECGGP
jgi:hypothetical protein